MKGVEFCGGDPKTTKRPGAGSSETLADVEDRLRKFYDFAPEGVIHASFESGTILDVNSSLLQTLGYSRAELLGKTLWTIHPLREQGRVRALFEEAKRRGRASARVAQKPRKGVSLWMEMTLEVLDCRGGKVIRETAKRSPPETRVRRYGKPSVKRRGRVKILLLDGKKGLVHNCEVFLRGLGYSVDVAEARREALEKFKAAFFNIALVDGDDVELLKEMGGGIPSTRRVVVSGNPTVENVITALNRGADAYLTTPLEESLLGRVIDEQLEAQAEEAVFNDERVAEYVTTRIKQLA